MISVESTVVGSDGNVLIGKIRFINQFLQLLLRRQADLILIFGSGVAKIEYPFKRSHQG
jgi:hypothetical protein